MDLIGEMGCLYCSIRKKDVMPAHVRGLCLGCSQWVRNRIKMGELNEDKLIKKGLLLPAEKPGVSWRKTFY